MSHVLILPHNISMLSHHILNSPARITALYDSDGVTCECIDTISVSSVFSFYFNSASIFCLYSTVDPTLPTVNSYT